MITQVDMAAACLASERVQARIAEASRLLSLHKRAREQFGDRTAAWCVAANRNRTRSDELLEKWNCSEHPWLVLAGVPGQGKTVAAARWVCRIEGGVIVRAGDVDRWPYGGGKLAELAAKAPALLVDDLGREDPKNPRSQILLNILSDRHTSGLPSVATSMLARHATGCYPDHVLDRLGLERVREDGAEVIKKAKHCAWLHLPPADSMRASGAAPDLSPLRKARAVERAAEDLRLIAGGFLSVEDDRLRAALGELGAPLKAVEKAARKRAEERRSMIEVAASFLGGGS